MPPVSVNPWLIAATVGSLGAGLLYLVWTIRQSHKEERGGDTIHLLGKTGVVITELAPRGVIRMEEGNWTAVTDDDRVIPEGERVIVVEMDDLVLTVIPFRRYGVGNLRDSNEPRQAGH